MTQAIPTPPDDNWHPVDDSGFIEHVGPLFVRQVGTEPTWIGFRPDQRHRNLNGVVQGGMLMTLADRGLGRIARTRYNGGPVSTVNFSYDFIGAAPLGRFVHIEPKVAKETGTMLFMQGEVFCDGDLIGRAHGIWKKLKRKPE